jgi:hypothetical protein
VRDLRGRGVPGLHDRGVVVSVPGGGPVTAPTIGERVRRAVGLPLDRELRVLTVQQPWAWAIAAGHKDIENRSWGTDYRGPLAIHAGKSWDRPGMQVCRSVLEELKVVEPGGQVGDRHLLAAGAIVAVVDLVGVCDDGRCRCSVWGGIGQKHWQLKNPRALAEPVPASGRLGLWDIDLTEVARG